MDDASANNVPSEVVVLPPTFIIPKYESILSEKITPGITKTDDVIKVPSVFGKMCFHIIRWSLAPSVRAAKTYS